MMQKSMKKAGAVAALAVAALLSAGSPALAQGWGTVKGTVIYDKAEKALPENKEANITNDKVFCLSKGKIKQDEWVIDEKTRGVKWVLVWLTDVDAKKVKNAAWPANKIHPNLAKAPATLVLDQPVCTFIPRMTGVRSETKVIFKNSATVAHNVKIEGGPLGPELNQLIPAGKEVEVGKIVARHIPISYACTIHPWMKGYINSFDHPYFAVTNEKGEFEIKDAPAGKFRLQVWHEGYGFLQKNKDDRGTIITIKDKETTELKPIEIKK